MVFFFVVFSSFFFSLLFSYSNVTFSGTDPAAPVRRRLTIVVLRRRNILCFIFFIPIFDPRTPAAIMAREEDYENTKRTQEDEIRSELQYLPLLEFTSINF